jgi:hypothetical protein
MRKENYAYQALKNQGQGRQVRKWDGILFLKSKNEFDQQTQTNQQINKQTNKQASKINQQ